MSVSVLLCCFLPEIICHPQAMDTAPIGRAVSAVSFLMHGMAFLGGLMSKSLILSSFFHSSGIFC